MRRSTQWVFRASFYGSLAILFGGFCLSVQIETKGTSWGRFFSVAHAEDKDQSVSVMKFKVDPLYRAVRLTWKVKAPDGAPLTFEIYRTMVKPDRDYSLVTTMQRVPGVKKYKHIDKSLQVEENYFYKLVIPETQEVIGPFQVRPPFSLPTT